MDASLSPMASHYLNALRSGDRQTASLLVVDAVESGRVPLRDVYMDVFRASQQEVGRLWSTGEMSVAEEHFCTAATQLIMSQLYPHVFSARRRGRTLVATSVAGEMHELPIRMVADFFEMDGWDTYYLGANTPAEDVVQAVIDRKAHVLAISATMAHNVDPVRIMIDTVRAAHAQRPSPKIMVGGWPFSQDPELWRSVGADGCAESANQAVKLAESWVP